MSTYFYKNINLPSFSLFYSLYGFLFCCIFSDTRLFCMLFVILIRNCGVNENAMGQKSHIMKYILGTYFSKLFQKYFLLSLT